MLFNGRTYLLPAGIHQDRPFLVCCCKRERLKRAVENISKKKTDIYGNSELATCFFVSSM